MILRFRPVKKWRHAFPPVVHCDAAVAAEAGRGDVHGHGVRTGCPRDGHARICLSRRCTACTRGVRSPGCPGGGRRRALLDRRPGDERRFRRSSGSALAAGRHRPTPPQCAYVHWRGGECPPELADHPVAYVSWYAAEAYALGGRAPPVSRWECAARGGLQGPSSLGRHLGPPGPTMPAAAARRRTCAYPPNPWPGVAGNVWEYCADLWQQAEEAARHPRVYGGRPELRVAFTSPPATGAGPRRVPLRQGRVRAGYRGRRRLRREGGRSRREALSASWRLPG